MTDKSQIIDHLHTFFEPGDVFEVRVLDAVSPNSSWSHTESGYFNYDQINIIPNCLDNFASYGGVYVTMNPVNPDLLARANNRLKAAKRDEATKDGDVLCRRWMLIDIDPERPAGISANDVEKAAALDKAIEIQDGLSSMGFPKPIVIDSGNGMQLFYRIDLPADDDDLVQRCLKALEPCSTDAVHVDLSVHNAARICRLPGTMNCKGDEIPGRVHRMAEVLETPEKIKVVSGELLQKLAGPIVASSEHHTSSSGSTNSVADDFNVRGDIAPVLTQHGWTLKSESDQQYWYRPGKISGKHSATYNGTTFYVFSSNAAPFEVKGYSRFGVYTKLEHGDDFVSATTALKAQGYGPKDDVDLSGLLAKFNTREPDSQLATASSIVHSHKTPEAGTGQMSATNQQSKTFLTRSDQIEMRSPQWLLHGILEQDTMALIFGEPGCGKSFLAIDWACRIATGTPWRGHEVTPGPVVYVAGEGQQGLGRRLGAWKLLNKVSLDEKPLYIAPAVAMTDTPQTVKLLEAINKEVGRPSLVVLDTLARNFGGGDENSTQDMSRFVAACDTIRNTYQCTLLVVHHSGHSEKRRARGAIALKAALDAEYLLAKKETGLTLVSTKMKDAEIPPPLAMELVSVELPDLVDDYGSPVTSAALDFIDANVEAIMSQAKSKPKRGKWMKAGCDIAKKLMATEGVVDVQDWHEQCDAIGMPKTTRYRILENLRLQDSIIIEEENIDPMH